MRNPFLGAARATKLGAQLDAAASSLIAVLELMDAEHWSVVSAPSVWSIGREAAHVAEAAVYHQWIVRLTIGERVSARRPAIERQELTTSLTRGQAVDRIRDRTAEGVALIRCLADDQLDLLTRPPRARASTLGETIDHVLIGHYDAHRLEIERKLRDM